MLGRQIGGQDLPAGAVAGLSSQDAVEQGAPAPVPADRPGDRVAAGLRDASLRGEVSGGVADDRTEHRLHLDLELSALVPQEESTS